MNIATIEQQATHECRTIHSSHLTSEGFSGEQVDAWKKEGKIFSISEDEARSMGFKIWDAKSKEWKSGSGLYFEFAKGFGQVRLDTPVEVREKAAR